MPTYEVYSVTVETTTARRAIDEVKQAREGMNSETEVAVDLSRARTEEGIEEVEAFRRQNQRMLADEHQKVEEAKSKASAASREIDAMMKLSVAMVWENISRASRGLIKLLGLNKTVAGKVAGVIIQSMTSMIAAATRAAAIAKLEMNWFAVLAAVALAIQIPVDIMNIQQAVITTVTDISTENKLNELRR